MSQKTRLNIIVLRMAEALITCFAIWFCGWLLYDIVALWLYVTSIRFQHLLLTLITIVLLVACELTRKSMPNTTLQTEESTQNTTEPAQNKPTKKKTSRSTKRPRKCDANTRGCLEPKGTTELNALREELSEIKDKLADMHAFDQVKKKREGSTHA